MEAAADLLERHPLLAGLAHEQVQRFAEVGALERYRAGEEIVDEGGLGDALYLVLSGAVTVVKAGRPLATLAPGEFFGEMCLMEPAARSATVVAADEAFLFRLPNAAVQTLLEKDAAAFTALLVKVVRVLSERLRRTDQVLSSVGQLTDWLAGSLV